MFECPIVGGTCIGIPFTESGTGVSVASAGPNPVSFGNVPINTTVSQRGDDHRRRRLSDGGRVRVPGSTRRSRFDFGTCGTGGGFTGPGTCTVNERYTPTALGASSGTTNVFECPIAGGTCIGIPFSVSGTGVSVASASPNPVSFGNVPINTTVSQA